MDTTYGYKPGTGPCVTHDASFIDTFNRDGIDTGAANLVYPTTRIRAIVGKRDDSVAPAHAQAYIDTLVLAGTPDATFQVIHYMGHGLSGQEGLAVFEEILLAE
jgi:hypothetical protein